MALVVEDGTGLANANGYVDVAAVDAYADPLTSPDAVAWKASTDTTAKENAIIRGTSYLDNNYEFRWQGRAGSSTQALDWPRTSVVDSNGYAVPSDAVPVQVENATAEMALRALQDPQLTEDVSPGGTSVKRRMEKLDVLETDVEYAGTSSTQTSYTVVEQLLAALLRRVSPFGYVERGH